MFSLRHQAEWAHAVTMSCCYRVMSNSNLGKTLIPFLWTTHNSTLRQSPGKPGFFLLCIDYTITYVSLITTKLLLTEKAKANIILYLTLICNPSLWKKRTTKYCMCSQHTWRNLYTFPHTYICLHYLLCACLHCTVAATLSYSTMLTTCANVTEQHRHDIFHFLTSYGLSELRL